MALLRPTAQVTIGARRLAMAEAGITDLRVDLGLHQAHDGATLHCWPGSKFNRAQPGDAFNLALGGQGDETNVLSGEVLSVRQRPDALVINGVAASITLSRRFSSGSHINPTVADVVRDLIGNAKVDRIDAPLKLGVWFADNRLSVWQQLQALARLAGADLGCAAEGGLRFVSPTPVGPASPSAPVRLRHGADLLHWDLAQYSAATRPATPQLAPHGAGSEAGSARWHWLAHDPVGAGADTARVPGALASRDAAQSASQALAAQGTRQARSGQLLIVGHATLRPGDRVQLIDLPGDDPGPLRVLAVQHRITPDAGFLTRLTVEAAA